jgi:hypothetical protein
MKPKQNLKRNQARKTMDYYLTERLRNKARKPKKDER